MTADEVTTAAGLWLTVVLSGVYHGVNPGMGWPLAVSAALMERRRSALYGALAALAAGHLAAMLTVLLLFALLVGLIDWEQELRLATGGLLIVAGVWLLVVRRHPRALARIPPGRLGLWSFAVAMAHGAGLMLAPIYLGICAAPLGDAGARTLIGASLSLAIATSVAHTAAMFLAGGAMAVAVHEWLGLRFLAKTWFNLDQIWAASLILVGVAAVVFA